MYVLPTEPNVCSYTTLAKKNCHISTCLTTGTGFISAKPFFCSWSRRCTHVCKPTEEFQALVLTALLKLSSFVSVSDVILLQLSEFHINSVNDCLYCISYVVCYKVEELRRRHDAKLQHVFLTLPFSSGVFLQNCQNWAWKRKKSFVEIKPVYKTRGNLSIQFRQGSAGTHTGRGGQYIRHVVGTLFRCHCADVRCSLAVTTAHWRHRCKIEIAKPVHMHRVQRARVPCPTAARRHQWSD